jgi:hypothetical protein
MKLLILLYTANPVISTLQEKAWAGYGPIGPKRLEKSNFIRLANAYSTILLLAITCRMALNQRKNGLHLCKPLMLLVAGRGFEPLTFGLFR